MIVEDEEELGEERQRAEGILNNYLTKLSKNNKEILDLTSTLPDRMESLEKLKVKLAKEDSERDEVIGGGNTYRRENV